jgi:hypothetical protein
LLFLVLWLMPFGAVMAGNVHYWSKARAAGFLEPTGFDSGRWSTTVRRHGLSIEVAPERAFRTHTLGIVAANLGVISLIPLYLIGERYGRISWG